MDGAIVVQFSVGIHLDADGRPMDLTTEQSVQLMKKIALRHVEGATISQGIGIWTDNDGMQFVEPSLTLTTVIVDPNEYTHYRVEGLAKELKAQFNQKSVLVVQFPALASFDL